MRLNLGEKGIRGLKSLVGECQFEFLGYRVDLHSGEIRDSLKKAEPTNTVLREIETVLCHYSSAKKVKRAGQLTRFAGLPGGQAYEKAFLIRAVQPIAYEFGSNSEKLVECAKLFGGVARDYCDCAVELFSLPHVPIVIILWEEIEFPAEASMLFDESASCYLPTEDLAVLGELTASRLVEAAKLPK